MEANIEVDKEEKPEDEDEKPDDAGMSKGGVPDERTPLCECRPDPTTVTHFAPRDEPRWTPVSPAQSPLSPPPADEHDAEASRSEASPSATSLVDVEAPTSTYRGHTLHCAHAA